MLIGCGVFSCDAPPRGQGAIPAGDCTLEVFFSPRGDAPTPSSRPLRGENVIGCSGVQFYLGADRAGGVGGEPAGVAVRVILDDSQETAQYSSATFLKNQNVPVWMDEKHSIAHNKIMLIDGRVIITGSFNFTKAAEESNAENLLIIRDNPELMKQYQENFKVHLGHSRAK